MPAVLPFDLQQRLAALESRERRQRLIRGLWRIGACAAASVLALIAIDGWLTLPPVVRLPLVAAWLGGIAFFSWRWIVRPARERIDSAALAAAVEAEYPRLDERLTSSVELANSEAYGSGSPAIVQLLLRETELKSRVIDFDRAAPSRKPTWAIVALVGAGLAVAIGVTVAPEFIAGLVRRLVFPWDARLAVQPFAIAVTPSAPAAARGRPWTVRAELISLRDGVALPEACTLVFAPDGESAVRLRMQPDHAPNTYLFELRDIAGNFRFHIEAGALRTDDEAIPVVTPVELSRAELVLTPPEYAAHNLPTRRLDALGDLGGLQHSRMSWSFSLTRPAVQASLVLADDQGQERRLPLVLSEDRQTAALQDNLLVSNRWRLVLEAERGILTESQPLTIQIRQDQPPTFRRVSGIGDSIREVSATDTAPIEVAVEDDVAVASVVLEYRINDGPIVKERLPLSGLGTQTASGAFPFAFAGRVHVGDRLACRLCATDNRNLPAAGLGPQTTTFPAGDRWCEWSIVSQAAPLREREIATRREAIDQAIRKLQARLNRDRQTMRDLAVAPNKYSDKLRELQQSNQEAQGELAQLAEQAAAQGLAPVADGARSIAEREVRRAADQLTDAAAAEKQRETLTAAAQATEQARDRLDRLRADNDQLAKQQLDAAQVERLADRQSDLAEQTKAGGDVKDEQLKKDQAELTQELEKLSEQNQAAKEALESAKAEDAHGLAEQARALAKAERQLDKDVREFQRKQNAGKLAGLAQRQTELADQADRLAKKLRRAMLAAQVESVGSAEATRAAELLRRGDAEEAGEQQRRSADTLEQLVDRLQSAFDMSRDAREAARQLSRLQTDTRRRTLDHIKAGIANSEELIDDQRGLLQAVERLSIPADQYAAKREQIDAAGKIQQALTALHNGHGATAADLMDEARAAMDRLAEALPAVSDRQKAARAALGRLRSNQARLTKEIQGFASRSAVSKPTADETADLAKQQAELADELGKLDAPLAESRLDAARQAAGDALDDLMAGRWPDIATSQLELIRRLLRLDQALQGQPPLEAKVRDLARRERELAAEAARAGDDAAKLAAMQPWQDQIARDVQRLDSTEAPAQQAAAVEAAAHALQMLRDSPGDAATPTSLQIAAEKLDALANQIAGREPDAHRATRLAKTQAELAAAAKPTALDVRLRQSQVINEAATIRGGAGAANEKQAVNEALARLQRLAPDSSDYRPASQAAADALQRLADRLAKLTNATEAPPPSDLAQRQRELAAATAAVSKTTGKERVDALELLFQKQRELRDQAQRLSATISPKAVQQARLAMSEAVQALGRQDTTRAQAAQYKAAAALETIAREALERAVKKSKSPTPGAPTAEQLQEARTLAHEQRQLLQQAAQSTATTPPPDDADERQDSLAQQTDELAHRMQHEVSQTAGMDSRDAESAMRQAQEQQKRDAGTAHQSRQRAAGLLDRAAEEADRQANRMHGSSPHPPPPGSGGRSLMKARGHMQTAQKELGQGQKPAAGQSMQRAAQQLQQAAQSMRNSGSAQNQGGSSGSNPNDGSGRPPPPISAEVARELERHPGKKWGELPGELRTRILQEVKAQYGDDYARIIRLYFESLADHK